MIEDWRGRFSSEKSAHCQQLLLGGEPEAELEL